MKSTPLTRDAHERVMALMVVRVAGSLRIRPHSVAAITIAIATVLALPLRDTEAAVEEGQFRRRCTSEFGAGQICVGNPAGLQGDCSLYAGLTEQEAAAGGWAGPGYGNSWRVIASKDFDYTGGEVTLSFDYVLDTERGEDFAKVLIDTSSTQLPVTKRRWITLWQESGSASGRLSFTLRPGYELPSCARSIRVGFQISSDGAWSPEDGLVFAPCGAFAVDDLLLTGGITASDDFESDTGWEEDEGIGFPAALHCYDWPHGAMAWWNFEEGSGATSQDIVGGRVATHTGSPEWVAGIFDVGTSLEFVPGSRWEVPHDEGLNLGTGDFSFFFQVRVRQGTVLRKRDPGTGTGFEIVVDSSERILFTMSDGAETLTEEVLDTTSFLRFLVAISVDRDDPLGMKFYVGGALTAELDPRAVPGSLDNTESLVAEGGVVGIDDVMIFDRALDPMELASRTTEQGVCYRDLHVPYVTPLCDGASSADLVVEMCNWRDAAALFDLEFEPQEECELGFDGGCGVAGPTDFVILDPMPVALGPGDCLPVRVRVTRPLALTSPGQVACYAASIINLDTFQRATAVGSLVDSGGLCVTPQVTSINPAAIIRPFPGQRIPVRLRLENKGDMALDLDYTLVPVPSDRRFDFVSLGVGGQPAGEPVNGSFLLNPPGRQDLETELGFDRIEPIRYSDAVLLVDIDGDGDVEPVGSVGALGGLAPEVTPVEDRAVPTLAVSPLRLRPNPAAGRVVIEFEVRGRWSSVPGSAEKASPRPEVAVTLYDVAGRRVRTLHQGAMAPGSQSLVWDGRDGAGRSVARGIYLVRVRMQDQVRVAKVLLLR